MSLFKRKSVEDSGTRVQAPLIPMPLSERERVMKAIGMLNNCDAEYSISFRGRTYVRTVSGLAYSPSANEIESLKKQFEKLHDGE